MTTKQIIWDLNNLPVDISEVEWVTHSPEREAAIEKMVEALEFYANPKSDLSTDIGHCNYSAYGNEIVRTSVGIRARNAIAAWRSANGGEG